MLLWWLCFCTMLVGAELAYFYGLLQQIMMNDITRITFIIVAILVWQTIACGFEIGKTRFAWETGKPNPILERGWFFSDIVLSLGMIGTVAGFMMMLTGFATLDFSDIEATQGMVARLGAGMATALSTTLIGLIASVLLKLQFFMLERTLEREEHG